MTLADSKAHIQTGEKGENIAVQYLVHQGHIILDRNWRFDKGELDIVSEYDGFLVITEVKTRTTSKYGEPYEDVDEKKQAILEETAEAYLDQNESELELRFDIISIVLEPQLVLDQIEDAF